MSGCQKEKAGEMVSKGGGHENFDLKLKHPKKNKEKKKTDRWHEVQSKLQTEGGSQCIMVSHDGSLVICGEGCLLGVPIFLQ